MGIDVIGGSGGGFKEVTKIITSTQSWTAPDDVETVSVKLVGGGGGGLATTGFNYGYHPAGGGGAVVKKDVTVTPGASYTITIGAGGSDRTQAGGGIVTAYAFPGEATTFGNILKAPGGGGAVGGIGPADYAFSNLPWFDPANGDDEFGSGGGWQSNEGWSASNENGTSGGGGGGAGSPARLAPPNKGNDFRYGNSDTVYFDMPYSPYGSSNLEALPGSFSGHAGAMSQRTNEQPNAWMGIMGGLGDEEGYGAGGSGGSTRGWNTGGWYAAFARTKASGNGGMGAVGGAQKFNATSGAINTGSGGGGGAEDAGNGFTGTAGSGGSGVAILKYWTAG